jgi:hypothetical protein
MQDERRPMIDDVQDLVCRVVFTGRVKGSTRDNWLGLHNHNAHARTLLIDHGRAKASRVNRRWHAHFREWLAKQLHVEARKAWAWGVDIALDMCNFVPLEDYEYNDGQREQYSVWLKNESLLALDFICREGKGSKQKGRCELVAVYAVLAQYRRMHGVAKTAAKQQAKQIKKKIVGVPAEAFVHPATRSPEDKLRLAAWASETRQALLEWLAEQHPRMLPKPVAVLSAQ